MSLLFKYRFLVCPNYGIIRLPGRGLAGKQVKLEYGPGAVVKYGRYGHPGLFQAIWGSTYKI